MPIVREDAMEAYHRGVVVESKDKEYAYYLGKWFVFKRGVIDLVHTVLPQDLVIAALGADVVIDVLLTHDLDARRRVMYTNKGSELDPPVLKDPHIEITPLSSVKYALNDNN